MERNDLIERLRNPEKVHLKFCASFITIDAEKDMKAAADQLEDYADMVASLSEALAEAEKKALESAAEAVRVLSYKQGTNSPAWIALRQAEDRIRNLSAPPRDLSQGG